MDTQMALYNALVKYLDENKVKEESLDTFSQSIKSLLEKINEGKTILRQLNETCLSIDKIRDRANEMLENIDPLLSTGIYESCKRLKDDIDLFESQILYQLNPDEKSVGGFHGLRGRDRLNVFLVGEFSAGKTTFVQRLISDLSGPISGAPATACLVIHKQASNQSLSVRFNKSIVVKDADSEKFERFLNSFDLRKRFNLRAGTWIPGEEELVFDNWDNAKILDFLSEGNRFPEMFNKIIWNHKKSARTNNKNTFLDFADIYDMPGIGGAEEKHNVVIERIFQEQKPDVILYLIDTTRGTPSDKEKKALIELLSYITKHETLPLFYWVYQKPSGSYSPLDMKSIDSEGNILDRSFLEEKKESIEDFIKELNNSNDNLIQSEKKYIEYFLQKTIILDARGLTTDTEMSQNAVSLALRDYFSACGKNYVDSVKKTLSDNSRIPQFYVMSFYPDSTYSSNNPFIEEILNLIRRTSDLSMSNVRKIIFDSFHISDDEDLSKYPHNLQQTLKDWLGTAKSIIEEILGAIKIPRKLFDKKSPEKISLDNVNNKFWEKYNTNPKWQTLLFTVQAYYWIKASYDKKIALQYISNIGNAMLGNIEKDINRLSKINVSLPIYIKVDIESGNGSGAA